MENYREWTTKMIMECVVEDWVIPLEWDDRRYLVIDVTDEWVNNPRAEKYFGDFWEGIREHYNY